MHAARRPSCTGNEHAIGDPDFIRAPVSARSGNQVPGRRELVSQQRSRRLSVHRHRRSVHRGRRLREAARNLGRLHVRPGRGSRRALGLSSFELRVAGRNLKTWTKYTGLDPETTRRRLDARASAAPTTSTCRRRAPSSSPSASTAKQRGYPNEEIINRAAALCLTVGRAAATTSLTSPKAMADPNAPTQASTRSVVRRRSVEHVRQLTRGRSPC